MIRTAKILSPTLLVPLLIFSSELSRAFPSGNSHPKPAVTTDQALRGSFQPTVSESRAEPAPVEKSAVPAFGFYGEPAVPSNSKPPGDYSLICFATPTFTKKACALVRERAFFSLQPSEHLQQLRAVTRSVDDENLLPWSREDLALASFPNRDGNVSQGNPPVASGSKGSPLALRDLPRDILRDQEFLWLRPFRPNRSDAPWAAAFFGITAALVSTDADVARNLSDTPPGSGFAFSRRVSQIGGAAGDLGVAGVFYLVGRWRKNERARGTGVLGLRALADSFAVVEALKTVTQRPRPTRDEGRVRIDNANGDFFEGGMSFPSGHAIAAWSLAAVVSCRSEHRRWVAVVAYSLAGLVSVARTTQRKHFPSDTFVGGALGFMIGRHVCHQD